MLCVWFAAERSDRQRLEKENSSLMAKTFAAPSTALVELQGLKTEVYSLRREKASAELREAGARRELADQTSKACLSHLGAVTADKTCSSWHLQLITVAVQHMQVPLYIQLQRYQ